MSYIPSAKRRGFAASLRLQNRIRGCQFKTLIAPRDFAGPIESQVGLGIFPTRLPLSERTIKDAVAALRCGLVVVLGAHTCDLRDAARRELCERMAAAGAGPATHLPPIFHDAFGREVP